jgi:hypothetical protein
MRKMKFVICMLLFLNSCAHLKIKSNQAYQSSDESDASDEKVEKIWLEYFDILNNGELKDVLSFMKPSVIFTFNNQIIETEDYDQLLSLLKQWKNNKNNKGIYIKNHSISSAKVADDFITIVDVVQGEYSNKTNTLIKEKRTFYYFHLVKVKGWKIYMITSAALEK